MIIGARCDCHDYRKDKYADNNNRFFLFSYPTHAFNIDNIIIDCRICGVIFDRSRLFVLVFSLSGFSLRVSSGYPSCCNGKMLNVDMHSTYCTIRSTLDPIYVMATEQSKTKQHKIDKKKNAIFCESNGLLQLKRKCAGLLNMYIEPNINVFISSIGNFISSSISQLLYRFSVIHYDILSARNLLPNPYIHYSFFSSCAFFAVSPCLACLV